MKNKSKTGKKFQKIQFIGIKILICSKNITKFRNRSEFLERPKLPRFTIINSETLGQWNSNIWLHVIEKTRKLVRKVASLIAANSSRIIKTKRDKSLPVFMFKVFSVGEWTIFYAFLNTLIRNMFMFKLFICITDSNCIERFFLSGSSTCGPIYTVNC